EGMYAILDGTHYNGGCCFDYGNAERNSRDNGNGTMEAIYFGNIKVWGYGTGTGPWVMADLENGLYSGSSPGYNPNHPTPTHRSHRKPHPNQHHPPHIQEAPPRRPSAPGRTGGGPAFAVLPNLDDRR